MSVVKEFYLGETKITICDDCCRGVTVEEAQERLQKLAPMLYRSLRAQHERNKGQLLQKR